MARLVQPHSASGGDDYLDRVAKYVPIEIVGAYLTLVGLIPARGPVLWPLSVLLLCWFLTPAYIWRRANPADDWRTHAAVSVIAFPVWAFAIGRGVFEVVEIGPEFLPALLLVAFSLVAGLIKPRPVPR